MAIFSRAKGARSKEVFCMRASKSLSLMQFGGAHPRVTVDRVGPRASGHPFRARYQHEPRPRLARTEKWLAAKNCSTFVGDGDVIRIRVPTRDLSVLRGIAFSIRTMWRILNRVLSQQLLPKLHQHSPSTLIPPPRVSALCTSPLDFTPRSTLASLHSQVFSSSSSPSTEHSASWIAFRKEKARRAAAENKAVEKICGIVNKREDWGVDTVNELENLKIRLRSNVVNKVLRDLENPRVARSFFHWAETRPSFHHSLQTFHAMIEIMGAAQDFRAQSELLQDMHRRGLQANTTTFNILLVGFSRASFTDRVVETFKQMEQYGWTPNAFTFKCVIRSLVWNTRALEALSIYMKMMAFGYMPDNFTYNGLIEGLCEAGYVDEAATIFQEMEDRGLSPDSFAHAALIKGLDTKGRVDEACRMFDEMNGKGLHSVVNTHKGIMGVFSKRQKEVVMCSDV